MRAKVSRPLVVALLAVAAPCAHAGDIHVPADYATIQAAIDAAVNGDAVVVSPGSYFENIDFKGKAITVRSSDGPGSTVIDGGGIYTVVRFVSGETPAASLEGFHLTHGYGPSTTFPYDGGGISCLNGSSPRIANLWIDYCSAEAGTDGGGAGGISCDASSPTIDHCRIEHNQSIIGGGIMAEHGATPLVTYCVITGNTAGKTGLSGGGGGIYSRNSGMTVVNCIVAGNTADIEGGGIDVIGGQGMLLVSTVVWGNTTIKGSGAWVWATTLTLWNSIVWNNDLSTAAGGTVDVHASDCLGGSLFSDPLFVDPQNGDFHLTPFSPCIDVGNGAAPSMPLFDIDGDPRIVGLAVDIGADETVPAPRVLGAFPWRTKYDIGASVTISGAGFSLGTGIAVTVGSTTATNVVVVDDQTITCDLAGGAPGPADVIVSNSKGAGALAGGFVFTPAITIEGDATLGSSITIHDLCEPGDGIFAVLGLPPQVSIPTPPFDGDLAIVPFHYFFYVTAWPFDSFDVPATIPNDPALVGVDVLLQSLIGARLTKPPKQGHWTNCAVLSIH